MQQYNYLQFFHFSVQLLMMLAAFSIPMSRRQRFAARLSGAMAAYLALGVPFCVLVRRIPANAYLMSILVHLLLFLVCLGILAFCMQCTRKEILFVGAAAYAAQHITFALTQIIGFFAAMPGWLREVGMNYLIYLVVALAACRLLVRPNQSGGLLKQMDFRMVLVTLAVLVCSIVLSSFVQFSDIQPRVVAVVCWLYAVVSCGLSLALQFDLSHRNKLEETNLLLEQMLHSEKQQHDLAKDTIDIINRKCHDLKYQIAAFRDMDSRAERQACIHEMENSVMIYDSRVQSGNDALDVILTEKGLLLDQYHIRYSYIIDGKRLNFLSVVDLYTLFNNALDNALESARQAPEEQRFLSLRVQAYHQMLLVHLDNTCLEPPVFVDGMPQTSKGDHVYHGFGTRSIRYIAEKYGGDVRMRAEGGKFVLDILFPLTQPEQDSASL